MRRAASAWAQVAADSGFLPAGAWAPRAKAARSVVRFAVSASGLAGVSLAQD
jgi:hypothetical protein